MVGKECEQILEESPDNLVMRQVMSEEAGGFVGVSITGAFCDQVLDQDSNRGVDTDKSAPVAPVYRV